MLCSRRTSESASASASESSAPSPNSTTASGAASRRVPRPQRMNLQLAGRPADQVLNLMAVGGDWRKEGWGGGG